MQRNQNLKKLKSIRMHVSQFSYQIIEQQKLQFSSYYKKLEIILFLYNNCTKRTNYLHQKMPQRPKSAILLSLPYTFSSKQQAVDIKQKVKKTLLTFDTESSLESDIYMGSRKISDRSYVDNGPSLLNTSKQHYSFMENDKSTKRSLKNIRARSAFISRRSSGSPNAGLENYKRLKPCKAISEKSLHNLQDFLNEARNQTKFIDRILQNLSTCNQALKKSQFQYIKKDFRHKNENNLEVNGQNFTILKKQQISAKLIQDNPYSTNVFQPTLQRKSSQLMKKSRAYLMARV